MTAFPKSAQLIAVLLLLASLSWAPQQARAATSCTASTTPLAFGTVTGNAAVNSTATVSITCTTLGLVALAQVRVRMCLNIGAGVNGGGQTDPRRMTNASADVMQFQIYRDPARSQIWGDSTIPATPTPLQIDLEYSAPLLGGSGTKSAAPSQSSRKLGISDRTRAQPRAAASSAARPNGS